MSQATQLLTAELNWAPLLSLSALLLCPGPAVDRCTEEEPGKVGNSGSLPLHSRCIPGTSRAIVWIPLRMTVIWNHRLGGPNRLIRA